MPETIFKKSVTELLYDISDRLKEESNNNENDIHKGKYNINMIETFWILHGYYGKVQQKNPQLNLDDIINKAVHNYEHIFKKETNAFIAHILDNIFWFSNEYIEESNLYPKDSKELMLLGNTIKSIKTWIDIYSKFTKTHQEIFNDFDIAWSPNKLLNPYRPAHYGQPDNHDYFLPSLFPAIKQRLKSKNKRIALYTNASSCTQANAPQDQDPQQSCINLNWLENEYDNILKSLFDIFRYSDDKYKDIRKHLTNLHPLTEKLIISMEYAIDGGFNYELLSIYLFISKDKSKAYFTKMISQKHELFIQCLFDILTQENKSLKSLFNIYYQKSISEIRKSYSLYPDVDTDYSTPLTIFNLYKIFVIYKSIINPMILDIDHKNESFHKYPTSVSNTLDSYIDIFNHSSLILPCYNIFISYPPIQLFNEYGLSIPEAAKLMGVNKSTLSRAINDKAISKKKYIWFWLALSGCTHEFLDGLTSLPYYGSDVHNDYDYFVTIKPLIFLGIAEHMIKNINDISEYKNSLGKNHHHKLETMSYKHQQEITSKCSTIANLIHTKRFMIEQDIYNKQTEEKSNNGRPIEITSSNINELSPNYNELIAILDETISALECCIKK